MTFDVEVAERNVREAREQLDWARLANVYALKLSRSAHVLDQAGARVAFEVAQAHAARAAMLFPEG